jgi:hypothetical protein
MRRPTQFAARLMIVLGILLNGLNPGMADMRGTAVAAPMTMPGMDMGSSRHAPGKDMPCGGMDCGCCIGGACAIPAVTSATQAIRPSWSSSKTGHSDAFLSGITFPPDIRPPI